MDLRIFQENDQLQANIFFEQCLPESGRVFDPSGRHASLTRLSETFSEGRCWCLFDGVELVGTAAVRPLILLNKKSDSAPCATDCELKILYLRQAYHGKGYGSLLLSTALSYALDCGYRSMYLDTIRSGSGAIALYRKYGFLEIPRYNNNPHADLFMAKDLSILS